VNVYDVQLENYSILTLSREALSAMEISLAKETDSRIQDSDHHIIVIPELADYDSQVSSCDKNPSTIMSDTSHISTTTEDDPGLESLSKMKRNTDIQEDIPQHENATISTLSETLSPTILTPHIMVYPPENHQTKDCYFTPELDNNTSVNLDSNKTEEKGANCLETTPISKGTSHQKGKNLGNLLMSVMICS
jgi:hypothetical protein